MQNADLRKNLICNLHSALCIRMEDDRENLARFSHLLSSPLTALRGAIDLLRRPRRLPADPLARELIESLERNCTRLREVVDTLLAHSQIDDGRVRIVAPLEVFNSMPDRPATLTFHTTPDLAADIAPAPAAAPKATEGSLPDDVPMTVLLIEDSATYRGVLNMLLHGAGYVVLEATNGVQGVDIARLHRPDLIVLDLELPRLSGQQVAQVLREDPDTKSIPLIYVSGYARLLEQAPLDVELVPKTAAPTALLDAIQRTIAAGRLRAEQPPSLLIVDDEPDLRHILETLLREDDYRVVTAGTGTEALALCQKQSFDLIILDLLLPDLDGFAVLGALRARPATALTPIILLSARDSAAEKVRGLQLGADDYVTKPFSAAELLARLRAALRRRELEGGANPSTRLPGNVAIERTIRRRIESNQPIAVCYTDLDNFKAYNDTYGFLKGDAVIHQTAHVLLAAVEQAGNRDDFVGHIGGDDFIVITTPDRAEAVCARAIAAFDALAPLFYDAETRARGYIDAHDRQGRPMRFPFVSLSIAVVGNGQRAILHWAEVAHRAVELKKRAKEIVGSAYVIEE
jgi:diguanylate cyclase (GGDEF)-like protein